MWLIMQSPDVDGRKNSMETQETEWGGGRDDDDDDDDDWLIDWLIDDRLYSAILRSLEQTHCARMWFYMSD